MPALRLALFLVGLGAALMLARDFHAFHFTRLAARAGVPYPRWMPAIGAAFAIAGIALLERFPLPALLLALLGTMIAFPAGGWLLVPGLALGAIWAARHHALARLLLGFGLLLPGIMVGFYGLEDWLGRLGRQPLNRLPLTSSPLIWLLCGLIPAWLGAWMLLPAARSLTPR